MDATTMKVVGHRTPGPIEAPDALVDTELPVPEPAGRDLLVEVRAVSVNPIDTKVRTRGSPQDTGTHGYHVLGYDASGVVRATGPDAELFRPGDPVYYAGDLRRPGTNAEYHCVDERIVGRKPESLDWAQAAALPLTAITAWELLFERLRISVGKGASDDRLLIVGAAGGVGSILTQLATRLTAATVIGTASRPESREWVQALGSHYVIDHAEPLTEGLAACHLDSVTHVAGLTHTDRHFDALIEALTPQGKLGLIDDPGEIDIRALKAKSLSLHWEMMFTRPMFETPDRIAQHRLLDELAALIDAGVLRSTLAAHYGAINAHNLKRAHTLLESGRSRGKIVLEGFGD